MASSFLANIWSGIAPCDVSGVEPLAVQWSFFEAVVALSVYAALAVASRDVCQHAGRTVASACYRALVAAMIALELGLVAEYRITDTLYVLAGRQLLWGPTVRGVESSLLVAIMTMHRVGMHRSLPLGCSLTVIATGCLVLQCLATTRRPSRLWLESSASIPTQDRLVDATLPAPIIENGPENQALGFLTTQPTIRAAGSGTDRIRLVVPLFDRRRVLMFVAVITAFVLRYVILGPSSIAAGVWALVVSICAAVVEVKRFLDERLPASVPRNPVDEPHRVERPNVLLLEGAGPQQPMYTVPTLPTGTRIAQPERGMFGFVASVVSRLDDHIRAATNNRRLERA